MQKDLNALSAVADKVRIYSLIDCNQAETILPAAKKAGLKVDLGIWTTFNHSTLEKEKTKLASLIDAGLYDDNVIGFDVAIYMYEKFEVDTAISYVKEIRDYLRSRGKNTPVTLADTYDVYTEKVVDAVDYVAVNYQSFMYGDDVNESVANTLKDLKDLRVLAASKGKKFVISETGWSSGGFHQGVGVATPPPRPSTSRTCTKCLARTTSTSTGTLPSTRPSARRSRTTSVCSTTTARSSATCST